MMVESINGSTEQHEIELLCSWISQAFVKSLFGDVFMTYLMLHVPYQLLSHGKPNTYNNYELPRSF